MMSSSGLVQKVAQAPKKNSQVWVSNALNIADSTWIVTSVSADGTSEKIIASYHWNPNSIEKQRLSQAPALQLQTSLTRDQRIFLSWDAYPNAKAYSLFYSARPDGVYEFYGDLTDSKTTAVLQLVSTEKELHFLVVPLSQDGKWAAHSNDAKVTLNANP